jgi:hypothetical protein
VEPLAQKLKEAPSPMMQLFPTMIRAGREPTPRTPVVMGIDKSPGITKSPEK